MLQEEDLIQMCMADGVRLRGSGRSFTAKCPFHHDTKPSFQVKLTAKGYWVFKCWSSGCGVHGGARKYRELTERPPPVQQTRRENAPHILYDKPTPELLKIATEHYHQKLLENKEATEYLTQRGIDPEKAYQWGLGYAPGDTLYKLLRPQMEEEQLEKCALLRHSKRSDTYGRRIIIPEKVDNDETGWITARAIDPDRTPKYLHSPGRRPALMTVTDVEGLYKDYKIITEGPFDMLAMVIAGFPAQCTNGSPDPLSLSKAIKDRKWKRLYILPDSDTGGSGWAKMVAWAANKSGAIPVLVELPEGIPDPAEVLLQTQSKPTNIVATAIRYGTIKYPDGWKPEHQEEFETQFKETETMAHYQGDPINFFGNLTKDPEATENKNGGERVAFGVAVNRRAWNSEEQGYKEETQYYDCVAFGVTGKQIKGHMRKGDFGWFAGNFSFRKYERRDGSDGFSLSVNVQDAHTNLQLVKRDYSESDGSGGDDRNRDRDRDRDRDDRRGQPEHERPRSNRDDNDRNDDKDSGRRDDRNDRDRDSGRQEDRDDDRGRSSSRDDDRDRARDNRDRGSNDDKSNDRGSNEGREENRGNRDDDRAKDPERHGSWSTPPDSEEDLPF